MKKLFVILAFLTLAGCATNKNTDQLLVNPEMKVSKALHKAENAYHKGMLDKAETLYLSLLAEHPKLVVAQFRLGNIYLRQGRLSAAINSYEAVLKIDNQYTQAWHNLAVANTRQAIKILEAGEQKADPKSSKYSALLALRIKLEKSLIN